MNTIAALFIALSPVTSPAVVFDMPALNKAANARAEQLADARLAEELALLSTRRDERFASLHSPDVVRPPLRYVLHAARAMPFGG